MMVRKKNKKDKRLLYGFLVIAMIAVISFGSVTGLWSTFENVGEDWIIQASVTQLSVGNTELVNTIQDDFGYIIAETENVIEVEPDDDEPVLPMAGTTVPRGKTGHPSIISEIIFGNDFNVEETSGGPDVIIYTYSISAVIQIQTHTDVMNISDGFILNTGAEEITIFDYAELAAFYGEDAFSLGVTFSLEPKSEAVSSTCIFDSANADQPIIAKKVVDEVLQDLDYFETEGGEITTHGSVTSVISGTDGLNTKVVTIAGSFSNGGEIFDTGLVIHEGFLRVPIEFEVSHTVSAYYDARLGVPTFFEILPTTLSLADVENNWLFLIVPVIIILVPLLLAGYFFSSQGGREYSMRANS